MVVVLAVSRARRRIEEIVSASDELEDLPGQDQIRSRGSLQRSHRRVSTQQQMGTYNARDTPNIRAWSPLRAKNDLRTAVLSRLDVVREVVLDPSS